MAKKEKKVKTKKKKEGGFIAEFKAFITRGNVLDMAVGVVIGGAFGAIVTAVVNILLSVCTWGIPGGLAGLVTVLPAAHVGQAGYAQGAYPQWFTTADFVELAEQIGTDAGASDPVLYGTNVLNSNYTPYGGKFVYKNAAVINWGALINAIISFLIIALTLFIIIKVAATMKKKREELKAKQLEAYYEKHPEERPVPPEPGVPEPTDHELLKDILKVLKEKK